MQLIASELLEKQRFVGAVILRVILRRINK